MKDERIEAVAKVIYEQWMGLSGYVPWVEHGNSNKQEDARRLATSALSASPTPPVEVEAVESLTLYSPYVASDRAGNTWGEMADAPDGEWLHIAKYRAHMAAKDAEIARLTALAYIGEHQHEDYTYKFRLDELRDSMRYRTSLIGRIEAERDEIRTQLADAQRKAVQLEGQCVRLAQSAAQRAAVPVSDDCIILAAHNLAFEFGGTEGGNYRFDPESLESFVHALFIEAAPAAPQQGDTYQIALDAIERAEELGNDADNMASYAGATGGFGTHKKQIEALRARLNADRSAQTDAARDVLAERRRQVEAEGWAPEHDDEHGDGEMAAAAACYAMQEAKVAWKRSDVDAPVRWPWPWAMSWWKPAGHRRNLVKAGALILAEIERLDRSAQGEKQ